MERVFDKLMKFFRPNGKANGHGERIKANETEIKNITKSMDGMRKENKDEHKRLFKGQEDIKIAIAKMGN